MEEKKIDLIDFMEIQLSITQKKCFCSARRSKSNCKKNWYTVVANFREEDMRCLGEGAPLVPIYHKAIFFKKRKNILVVNIGGISNFTFYLEK